MGEIWQSALRHLLRRRARTALTVGGILVGVLLVALTSVIGGVGTAAVEAELTDMGLRGLSVTAASGAELTGESWQTVRAVSGVEAAAPLVLASGSGQLGGYAFSAYLGGVGAGENQVIALEPARGRLLHDGDVASAAAVCVVDEAVAAAAYGRGSAVGRTLILTVGGITLPLKVVGVAKAGSSLLQGMSGYLPGLVYLPYTTLQAWCGRDTFSQIAVQVTDAAQTGTVRARVVAALERQSGLTGVYAAEDLSSQRERLSRLMEIVGWILTAISAVSLAVAGMGVMTSMLTAVNERVREIGIKQALGAGRGRILAEFLTEAALVAALGGAAGIGLGALVGAAGLAAFGLPITLPWGQFAGLWGLTVGMGTLCGWYPARRAASLRPAEALRADS